MKIKDFKGRIYKTAKDQYGCRYLQALIDEDPKIIGIILEEIQNRNSDLMTDPFGNYLCQKIAERADDTNLLRFIYVLKRNMVNISMNTHGTRACQKLVENVKTFKQVYNNYLLSFHCPMVYLPCVLRRCWSYPKH